MFGGMKSVANRMTRSLSVRRAGCIAAPLALAALAAPMMGMGPWDWGYRRDRHRDDRRGEIIVRVPPVVVVTPCEESPYDLKLSAYQSGGTVMIFVEGSNRTGGYTTALAMDGCSDGRPRLVLHNTRAGRGEYCSQVITPFSLNASVRVEGEVRCIPVRVADRVIDVPVVCVPRLS